jgi:hypothetical protein
VYTAVRVKNDGLERHGQVGVFVGPGDAPDESAVKFESETPGGAQEVETFKDEDLEAV